MKDDDSDSERGFQQVEKRRKSVQKGPSDKVTASKQRPLGGKGKVLEKGELAPESSVYDSGTNSEEIDKKRGVRSAKGKKGGPSE